MNDVIEYLESEIMPEFKTVAARLAGSLPSLTVSTESHYAGHPEDRAFWGMYISCLFREATQEQIDLVDLCLEVANLQATPTVNADMCWGHPSGHIEMSFCEDWQDESDWPEASPEKIKQLRVFLPRLFTKLEEVLNGGPKPIEEEV